MKSIQRAFWITVLLLSVVFAGKLALKPMARPTTDYHTNWQTENLSPSDLDTHRAIAAEQSGDHQIFAKYPAERELVARLLASFGHNARRIEASDGVGGLHLLEQLGDGAVCLYEARPDEFHQLACVSGSSPEAAKLVRAWGRFFDPTHPEHAEAAQLASDLGRLPVRARRLAERTPEALPFLLTDAKRVATVMERFGDDSLEPLAFVDLSDGGASLRRAIAVLDRHGRLSIDASEQLGPAGFMLVERYGPLIESLQRDLGLARSLVVVGTAFEDLERLMERHRMRTVADVVLHLEHRGLLDVAAAVPNGLRLAIEFGADGEAILATVGAPGVAIAYDMYKEGRSRNAIVQAMGRGGLPAAVAAKKHAASEEFQKIVARDGSAAVQAVAVACSAEEARRALSSNPDRTWTQSLAMAALKLAGDSGEKTIRMIDRDGLDRVESLTNPHLQMYQFLPLYDLSHLASVFTHGYAPTRGEFVWAGVDAVLVAADVLSVLSLQPEVVVATEVARTGLKSTARTSVKAGAQSAATHAGEAVAGQATRQIARETGERLLQRTTEIASRPAEAVGHELAESLARRAGIRLASWHTQSASRFLFASSGKLPHSRLSKYVVANGAQAAVGLIAVRKMEEYLEGRGSSQRNRTDLNL